MASRTCEGITGLTSVLRQPFGQISGYYAQMSASKKQPSLSEALLLATVARRFYVQGRSKLEIADEFGVSRFKVARMLDTAMESGLVRVEFSLPAPIDLALSDEIRAAYRLDHALVLERAAEREPREVARARI